MSLLSSPAGQVIGRDQDVRLVMAALRDQRLVTLVGAGGVGKTALAVEAANEAEPEFARVVAVGLVNAQDRSEVACLISSALLGEPVEDIDRMVGALAATPTLLVIDNCEQAIDVVAELVAELMEGSPETRIMATSRRPLDLAGEVTLTVRPLGFPVDLAAAPVTEYASVQLFLERVRQADPTFELAVDDAGLVGSICARADGVPLVIELAAALVRSHSLADIFTSMVESPGALAGNRRDLHEHQRSVAASLDWSRRFLSADEQRLLGSLSVFAGGFTAAAARQIGKVSDDGALTRLVDHSMVSFDRETGRYRLLELIRADAESRHDGPEWDDLVDRHLAWCQDLAAEIGDRIYKADPERVFRRYSQEIPNLGVGLRRCWQRGEVARFRQILSPMANWWVHHARPQGVEKWAELLDDPEITDNEAIKINLALAYYWSHRGDFGRSTAYAEDTLHLADRVGDPILKCGALTAQGNAADALGDSEQGLAYHQRALAVGVSSGHVYPELWARVNLARSDPANAGSYLAGALERASRGFTVVEALVVVELARVALSEARLGEATELADRGVAIMRDAGFGEGLATALNAKGEVAVGSGDVVAARAAFDEALNVGLWISHEGVLSAARSGLKGLPDEGVARPVVDQGAEPLTERELAVAFLLRGDLTQREIAEELYVAPSTVKTHTKSIYRKLGVSKRSHAITRAAELGLFNRS